VAGENEELTERIQSYNPTAEIIECAHKPQYLQNLYDPSDRRPLEFLKGRYIGVLSGIARPESFEGSLTKLGANSVITARFADHHRFNDEELRDFVMRAVNRDLDCIVTTEKDAVRFPAKIEGIDKLEVPIYYLRIEVEIIRGQESWDRLINRLTKKRDVMVPERFVV